MSVGVFVSVLVTIGGFGGEWPRPAITERASVSKQRTDALWSSTR